LTCTPPGQDGYYGYGLVNAWYSNQRPPGDINYDLVVDLRDLALVTWYWDVSSEDPDWWYARPGDIIIDNEIDILDLAIIGSHFGQIDP
jgi:hypothetical protein